MMSCNKGIWDLWCMLHSIFRFLGGPQLRIQCLYVLVIMVQISGNYINYNRPYDTFHPKIKKMVMLHSILKFLWCKWKYLGFNSRSCYRTSVTWFSLKFALPTKSKGPYPFNCPYTHINESEHYQNVHILCNLKKQVLLAKKWETSVTSVVPHW